MGKGGYRTGAGRPAQHRKTSYLRSIDVRRLQRDGFLKAGTSFGWSWKDDSGNVISSINITINSGVLFHYRINDQAISQHVKTTTTQCNYGGERVWFLCPYCYRRCAIVYTGSQVACRTCHKLKYSSQSEDETGVLWRKQRKLEARLGGADYWRKPKGMHQTTFDRIRREIIELGSERDRLLVTQYRSMFGREDF